MNAYSYDRVASQSFFTRKVEEFATSLAKDLDAAVVKYTGNRSSAGTAYVGVEPGNKLEIRLWLELGPEGNRAEAQELAEILVGRGVEVGQHKAVPTLWVAHKIIQL